MNKIKWTVLIFILVSIFILTPIAAYIIRPKIETLKISNYLKNRYGKDFEVHDVRKEGEAVGMTGSIFATARPKDGSTGDFFVRQWKGGYLDEYPNEIYNNKEARELSDFTKNLNITPVASNVRIKIDPNLYDRIHNVPDLESILSTDGDLVEYGVVVTVDGESMGDDSINDLNSIVEYVAKKNQKNNSVRYTINNKDNRQRYICQYYSKGKSIEDKIDKSCFAKYEGVE